ncbi:MAG: F0F1 ATP synthase subunit B [Cyanobacteriota bacterium]
MGILTYLATSSAEAASEGGFGLNLDILDTNLINLVIIIGVLIFYGRKFLGKILTQRRARIEQDIREAEKKASEAATALADAQKKLSQAQAEAEKIRVNAQETAEKVKQEVLSQGTKEVERIQEGATQDLNTERDRAIAQLRQQVVTLAMGRVESQLQERLDESAQHQYLERCIAQLGGR